jgi:hypothetical protein
MADVAIVKGETPPEDRTWLSFPDGTALSGVVRVIHDLPHLVVESVFGIGDGLWGTLAAGGFPNVTSKPGERNWPGHVLAKAAVNAVVNRWNEGPDTPDGVRDRMRASGPDVADLADRLDDETIRVAVAGVKRLYRAWRALSPGGALRLTWPLHDSWLRRQDVS